MELIIISESWYIELLLDDRRCKYNCESKPGSLWPGQVKEQTVDKLFITINKIKII